jgi:hypothetical protein
MNSQDFETEARYAKSISGQQRHELRQQSSVNKLDRSSQIESLADEQGNEVGDHQNFSDQTNMTTVASRKARIFCLTLLAMYVVAHQFILAD